MMNKKQQKHKKQCRPKALGSETIKGGSSVDAAEGDSKYAHIKTKRSSAALRGVIWSAINSIVPTLLNSLVFIVSSRYLMPHDFGILALAVSVISLASAFAPAALGDALIQQLHIRKSHLDTVFWICVGSSLLIYGVLIVFSPVIAVTVGQLAVSDFLPVLGLKVLFDISAAVPNALIARSMSFHLIAVRTIVATLISSVICIGLLVSGYGIWALVISLLAGSMTSCVAAFIGAKWLPGFDVGIKDLRDLSRYGLFASANRFLQLMNLDQLVIGSFIGPAPLGIFNFSRRLFQMLNDVIAGALTSVSHTLLSSLQSEKEKVREAFLLATYGSSIVSFPAFVGLASVVGDAIPLVFGAQWSEAIWPTRWFCIIGLMSCIGVIQSSLINSQGKSDWWFYYQFFRQILTIATIVVLHDKGISYIVMAIALQTLLLWPVTLVMVAKIINLKITSYFRQFLEPLFASAIMLATVLLMGYYFQGVSPIIRLAIEIGCGAVVYALSIFVLSREKILIIVKSFRSRNE
ncbi:MAG: lipopolysaccharide biosynthesis protein [Methylobacter sp.]